MTDSTSMRELVARSRPPVGDKDGWADYQQRRQGWVDRLRSIADSARSALSDQVSTDG